VEAIGYHVRDASSMRDYLLAHNVKCSEVKKSDSGTSTSRFKIRKTIAYSFFSGNGTMSSVAISPLSNQNHSRWICGSRPRRRRRFYRDILGFDCTGTAE